MRIESRKIASGVALTSTEVEMLNSTVLSWEPGQENNRETNERNGRGGKKGGKLKGGEKKGRKVGREK